MAPIIRELTARRARMAEIEGTIANFARVHRQILDPQLPSMDGPRALLRARLCELASKPEVRSWHWLFQFPLAAGSVPRRSKLCSHSTESRNVTFPCL